jgi:hypothetical protein
MAIDVEIDALRSAYSALRQVHPNAQVRALEWLHARISWEHRAGGIIAQSLGRAARNAELASKRTRRRAASVDRSPEGQDAEERLDAEHESAVPQADAQTPSPNLSQGDTP